MNEKPPFRYALRVRYGECDQQGVVFNARYGEYVDLASTEFLRHALAPADVFGGTFEFQVVRLLVEWKAPARFDDTLDITVAVRQFGTTSFTLVFQLTRRGDSEPLATAETVNVHVDPKAWTKTPLPAEFRAKLEAGARGMVVDQSGVPQAYVAAALPH